MSRVLQIVAASTLLVFGLLSGPLRMVAIDSPIDVAAAQTPPADAQPGDTPAPKAKTKTTAKKKVDAAKKKVAAKKKAAPKDVDTTPPERN